MSLGERVRTAAVLSAVAFLALRVLITLASPHPLLLEMPEACAASSENCARLDGAGGHRMDGVLPLAVPYGGEDDFWAKVDAWAEAEPRVTLLHKDSDFRHYAVQTELWGFVDDVTVSVNPTTGEVVMQSSSRVGLSDLGVNPERLTTMADALR
jgi:uncharacterized protein (DUF1499 family)